MGFPPPTEKQARILWRSLTALAIAILLALLGIFLWSAGWVLNQLSDVLLPLAIAGIIAYLLDPAVDFFEKKRIARPRAILLVFFLGVMLVLILLATVVPRLVVETEGLVQELHALSEKLENRLDLWMKNPPTIFELPMLWKFAAKGGTNAVAQGSITNAVISATKTPSTNQVRAAGPEGEKQNLVKTEAFESVLSWLAKALPRIGQWFLAQLSKVVSWVGLLIGLSLVPVYTFYFLLEKQGIQRKWTDYLPIHESKMKDELVFVLQSINDYLILFFRGQVLVALCDGALLTCGFLIIGLNSAFVFGVAAGLLSIVPYLGVLVSIIPALALAAVQFGDWLHPVLVLSIFGLVQLAEGLVISPKIMGNRVGLHPLTIIIAVMVGTTLMGGIIGGILAIPLTAALRVLMFRYVWNWRAVSSKKSDA